MTGKSPTLVFIVGCQRSGTTLTGQILGAHPNAILLDEPVRPLVQDVPVVGREEPFERVPNRRYNEVIQPLSLSQSVGRKGMRKPFDAQKLFQRASPGARVVYEDYRFVGSHQIGAHARRWAHVESTQGTLSVRKPIPEPAICVRL